MNRMRSREKGFSLVELVIALAIIGILAAIAAPLYRDHLADMRRTDGQSALLQAAHNMQKYYSANGTYIGAVLDPSASEKGFYAISFSAGPTAQSYTMQAVPQAGQAGDGCGTLTIDQAGRKTAAGPLGECW